MEGQATEQTCHSGRILESYHFHTDMQPRWSAHPHGQHARALPPAPRLLPRDGLSQDNSDSQQSPITLLDRFAGDVQRNIQAKQERAKYQSLMHKR